ncbi:MAG TPA: 30S ribosomal protein S6 [Firmicutes bacterium]|nr:30S ribosomal protein S6 [Bacillota bacterium]
MRDYEVMFIIRPDLDEAAIEGVINKFEELIKNGGGEILKLDRWGKRRLAYEIQHLSEGFYVVIQFKAPSELAHELERVLRITDEVIRHLVTRKDE